jgi:hypothetical protein
MSKAHTQDPGNEIVKLRLRLIAVESMINHLSPVTLGDHLAFNQMRIAREQELRKLEAEAEAIPKQIALLEAKIASQALKDTIKGKKRPLKQEVVYKTIESMQKRSHNSSKAKLFSKLAEERDESAETIKKAYYDQANKLKRERDAKARTKRDSEGDSNAEQRGGK